MDGLFHGTSHLEMNDDSGYPYFRKPPNWIWMIWMSWMIWGLDDFDRLFFIWMIWMLWGLDRRSSTQCWIAHDALAQNNSGPREVQKIRHAVEEAFAEFGVHKMKVGGFREDNMLGLTFRPDMAWTAWASFWNGVWTSFKRQILMQDPRRKIIDRRLMISSGVVLLFSYLLCPISIYWLYCYILHICIYSYISSYIYT